MANTDGARALINGFRILATAAGVIWLAGLVQDLALGAGLMTAHSKIWLLDADEEQSLLTWVSVLLLFSCSAALYSLFTRAVSAAPRIAFMWGVLACAFLGLSADEMLSFHEKLVGPIKTAFGTHGFLTFAWVLAAVPACAVGLIASIPLLRALSPSVRFRILLAGGLYVGGAVGMEMIGGEVLEHFGDEHLAYRLCVNVEEGLEVLGAALFLHTALRLALAEAPAAARGAAAATAPRSAARRRTPAA